MRIKPAVDAVAGGLAIGLLKLARRFDPQRVVKFSGAMLRRIGPWLPEHKVGRANLRAAFPEKSDAEVEAILLRVWENVGRVAAEYAHLDRLVSFDRKTSTSRGAELTPDTLRRLAVLRDDDRPALIFAAHLGNWELPAVGAALFGLPLTVLYRAPNIGNVEEAISRIRSVNMGTLVAASPEAPFKLAAALDKNEHVGMLVDQHYGRGVEVTFLGRKCMANPLIARLARHYECPIHGARAIRLPDGGFLGEVTEAIEPVRDADGRVEIAGTMQVITSVVEGWVREHPDQWLWLHRRWR